MALLAAVIYAVVMRLAEDERADGLKAVSPGMLPPMGILFALIVGFLAVGVWGDERKSFRDPCRLTEARSLGRVGDLGVVAVVEAAFVAAGGGLDLLE